MYAECVSVVEGVEMEGGEQYPCFGLVSQGYCCRCHGFHVTLAKRKITEF